MTRLTHVVLLAAFFVVGILIARGAESPKKSYEYKAVFMSERYMEDLNSLGKDGWRLVATDAGHNGGTTLFFFERER